MQKTIDYKLYEEKILGGWLGKSVGGVIGAALENHKELKHLPASKLWPAQIPPNDDLDIQLVWLELMQEKGVFFTQRDLVRYWQERCWYNFCEYGFFMHNAQCGIMPPLSGAWNNQFFSESEGCPIRSDIWGMVAPGNPKFAAELAKLDGQLDHAGLSVETEMFNAAMSAAAFFASSRQEIISEALAVLPAESRIHEIVKNIKKINSVYPDFAQAWRLIMREYGDRDASKAVTNLAIVLLAWFNSGDDFEKAMVNCANAGWDTDCTAATLAGIIGIWKGPECIPSEWKSKLGEKLVCGINVKHKYANIKDLAPETALIGVEMSLVRNQAVEIKNAPKVELRPEPSKKLEIEVKYQTEPVLYAGKPGIVEIIIKNPSASKVDGVLEITAPANVELSSAKINLSVPASGSISTSVCIKSRIASGEALPMKNLFNAKFTDSNGISAEEVFGLTGARQWLVYGPYWDMWDKQNLPYCPYKPSPINGNNMHPGAAGLPYDSYDLYVDINEAYLNEEKLIKEEMPEEVPGYFEAPADLIKEKDFCGWHGPACYYFARTILIPEGYHMNIQTGRTGYLRLWVDGVEKKLSRQWQNWTVFSRDTPSVIGTGKPQRIVCKLVSTTDEATLSFYFLSSEAHKKDGICLSHFADWTSDIVPTAGYRK